MSCSAKARRSVALDRYFEISMSEYLCRNIQFGIYKQPLRSFCKGDGMELGNIYQTTEFLGFEKGDIRKGLESGIYKKGSHNHARRALESAAVISSAFVVWQDRDEERVGRLVINSSVQSKFWSKASVRMETHPEFSMNVHPRDRTMSVDTKRVFFTFSHSWL